MEPLSKLLIALRSIPPILYLDTFARVKAHVSGSTGAGVNGCFNAGSVVGRLALGLAADTRLGKINTYAYAVLISGLLQYVVWLPANDSVPASFIFAFTFGVFGGGELGLYPTVLVDIFPGADVTSLLGVFLASELPGTASGLLFPPSFSYFRLCRSLLVLWRAISCSIEAGMRLSFILAQ